MTSSHDFLSGTSGDVWGIRATSRALVRDLRDDALALGTARPLRLRRAAARWPRRRVLVLATELQEQPNLLSAALAELRRSRHHVELVSAPSGRRGKWQNLQSLLEVRPATGRDWLLVLDDDVWLPRGFLDSFVFLAERFALQIAQPAHRARSHAAWQVTRRRGRSLVRETAFVESGPVVGFHSTTFDTLLPFPPLRTGWGLDAHWSALAREREWRIGILDAVAVRHGLRRIATAYDKSAAIAEAAEFLTGRPYVDARGAQETLVSHRSWRRRSG